MGVNPHLRSISRFTVDMGDKGPLSGPTIDGDVCCSSKCWQCGFGGITVCRGTNAPGKPNTREWSRSVGTGERGEKAGGVGGKLPGGVIHPASDGHVVGQLILDIRFLPCKNKKITY